MKRLNNDDNIKNLLLRKKIRIVVIILGFLTIVLAILDLYYRNWLLLGGAIVSFTISAYLTKKRDKIIINKSRELEQVEKVLNSKKKSK